MTLSESTPIESTFMDPHLLITEGGSRVVDLARFIVTSNSMKSDRYFILLILFFKLTYVRDIKKIV